MSMHELTFLLIYWIGSSSLHSDACTAVDDIKIIIIKVDFMYIMI